MGSVHNDLHSWAAKARSQGRDTIEIDIDTADRAAEQIVDLSNRVMDLEHQIRTTPAPVSSSDQPEQGGGMEVVADGASDFLRRVHEAAIDDIDLEYAAANLLHGRGAIDKKTKTDAVVAVKTLRAIFRHAKRLMETTPAEPAEARVRELEREVEILNRRLKLRSKVRDTWKDRATAAKAQLAKAKEALERIEGRAYARGAHRDIARQTLAALQEAGEVG